MSRENMDKWEYLIEPLKLSRNKYAYVPTGDDEGRSDFERSFASLGRDRWELIQILPCVPFGSVIGTAYFKRLMKPPTEE